MCLLISDCVLHIVIADLFVGIVWRLRWCFPPKRICVYFCPASRAASNLGSLQFSIKDWDYLKLSFSHCHCLSTSCIPSFLDCNTLLSQFIPRGWGSTGSHAFKGPGSQPPCPSPCEADIGITQPVSKPSTWEKVTSKARLLDFYPLPRSWWENLHHLNGPPVPSSRCFCVLVALSRSLSISAAHCCAKIYR